jgi:hypothetical protein
MLNQSDQSVRQGLSFLGLRLLSVRRKAVNRVTINCLVSETVWCI